jgi:hypothetical protein
MALPTNSEKAEKIHFVESIADIPKSHSSLKTRKKKPAKKKTPKPAFLAPSIEIPLELLAAKEKLIEDVFGGEAAWEEGHDEGKKRGEKHGLENIVGVSIGQKKSKGKPTAQLCVIVHVLKKPKNKADEAKFRKDLMIPKTIKVGNVEVLTDIQKGQKFKPQSIIGGDLCGINQRGAVSGNFEQGAIGFFCTVFYEGEPWGFLLANSHVIGEFLGAIPSNTEVHHPVGPNGQLVGFYHKSGGGNVDAAIAFTKGSAVDLNQHRGFSVVSDLQDPFVGQKVKMFGSRSGQVRSGRISQIGLTTPVPYPNVGSRTLHETFTIESTDGSPFSVPGDSGSGIVEAATNRPVGLLVGGTGPTSLGQRISFICNDLGIVKILG